MIQELIVKEEEQNEDNKLSVSINNDRLKYFFYMLHGEPTTRTRALHGAVMVSKSDICDLVKQIKIQLKLVHVTDAIITISLGLDKDFIEKTFDDFANYEWQEAEKTKEVIVRVHFMYQDLNMESTIKNTLFIRIAKGIKPGNIFQMIASSKMDSLDNIEDLMSPVFCRTDNINDKLSKDLLGVVENWHAGQKQPNLISNTYKWLKKNKTAAARFVHYSIPSSIAFIACYSAFSALEVIPENQLIPTYVSIIIISKLLIEFFLQLCGSKAKEVYTHLSGISHEDVIFDITKGDDKDYSEVVNKNKELFNSAKGKFLWINFQAVTASIVAALIIEYFK